MHIPASRWHTATVLLPAAAAGQGGGAHGPAQAGALPAAPQFAYRWEEVGFDVQFEHFRPSAHCWRWHHSESKRRGIATYAVDEDAQSPRPISPSGRQRARPGRASSLFPVGVGGATLRDVDLTLGGWDALL
mmetsp:Transcript_15983/g.43088  ORF Transcript_15983/g.43088 Transcript_15983/m.43088 type:complete len:132 (+) Transcript_15983:1304-1699(+)